MPNSLMPGLIIPPGTGLIIMCAIIICICTTSFCTSTNKKNDTIIILIQYYRRLSPNRFAIGARRVQIVSTFRPYRYIIVVTDLYRQGSTGQGVCWRIHSVAGVHMLSSHRMLICCGRYKMYSDPRPTSLRSSSLCRHGNTSAHLLKIKRHK